MKITWHCDPTFTGRPMPWTTNPFGDVAAAARIVEILASRLKVKDILAVTYELKKGERYHGKIQAFVDSLRENGIQLI